MPIASTSNLKQDKKESSSNLLATNPESLSDDDGEVIMTNSNPPLFFKVVTEAPEQTGHPDIQDENRDPSGETAAPKIPISCKNNFIFFFV